MAGDNQPFIGSWLLLGLASVAYVGGGIAMKYADGFRNGRASALVFVAFCAGAAMQTLAMRTENLSTAYVLVLAAEAILAVIAGRIMFQETIATQNIIGIVLVIVGIVLVKMP